jgi:hypothetical protein
VTGVNAQLLVGPGETRCQSRCPAKGYGERCSRPTGHAGKHMYVTPKQLRGIRNRHLFPVQPARVWL